MPTVRTAPPPADRTARFLRRRRAKVLLLVVAAAMVAGAIWLLWPFWQLSGHFGDQAVRQPSRLYARPTVLTVDRPFRPADVVEELRDQGYREAGDGGLPPGTWRAGDDLLLVHLRPHPTAEGTAPGGVLRIGHNGRRVGSLEMAGESRSSVALEPVLLASYFGDDLQERIPVVIDAVPEDLIWAVLAAEDEGFFDHAGLSPAGIARAAWKNLRGGEVTQGGSTLTQQLVKNLYLTHERTLGRKAREAVLALLLEARYDKREILQAYLNEIYLGASNGVSVMGMGAAARAYFGKRVGELTLPEAATLAGMIQVPARYMPTTNPEDSRRRRDWVLDRMAAEGFLEPEAAAAAKAVPLEVHPQPVVRRRAPYFADHAVTEAERRFGVTALAGSGHALLSTLDWRDQRAAQEAVRWGVQALEDGWEKSRKGQGEPLQAALVSLDPGSGGIRAYVGGRDYGASQFDRVDDALRQAGSAFKPVVYAAAFADGRAYPAAFVEDEPLTVRQAGSGPWSPRNSDGTFHGWVTVRTAVEDSLNVATARVALQTGLPRVVEVARGLGVETPLEPVPAIALGAFEVTPLQLATVYATFAAGGERPPVHALDAVLGPDGRALEGQPLPAPERVVTAETAYLITSVLQGVIDHGTAASARRQGVTGPLAGKTGTTNDRRDSWFSGYSPDRVTTVWVGYDDNRSTSLSGARAGVPIWSRFVKQVEPRGGYRVFPQPGGIATAVIDPTTGQLATDDCPVTVTEVYPAGRVPSEQCDLHQDRRWFERWRDGGAEANGDQRYRDRHGRVRPGAGPDGGDDGIDEDGTVEESTDERAHPFRRWLRRVFGGDDDGGDDDRDRRDGGGTSDPP